jgi:integrase
MQYNITYRQKDKGWQYIISYKDMYDNWKQKSKQGFAKKGDAQKAAIERAEALKTEVETAKNIEPGYEGITFGEFAKELLEHEKIHKSYNSIHLIQTAVNKFDGMRGIPVTELKHSDIQKCVDHCVLEGLKLLTIQTYISKIKYVLNQAVSTYKIIPSSPVGKIKLPELEYEEEENLKGKALNKAEIQIFLNELQREPFYLKHYYLCSFALNTGLREGELLGLTWDDVNFSKAEIRIHRQWKLLKDKTYGFGALKKRKSKRVIPISRNTVLLLKEYKEHCNIVSFDKRVFPFCNVNIAANIKDISKRLGFKVTMHMLRHTYATNLIANGIDFKTAAALLGHDVEMTMRTYSHVTDDMMQEAAKRINAIF